MKVSVLIPYYNDREFLAQAIESVLNQSFEDFELILVNHATTDDCREIAHSYNDKRIVHMDMEKNYGAGTGLVLERILKFAKGEYIKLFCADDVMYRDGLKILVDYMDTHPEKDFAFGNVEYIDEKGESKNKDFFSTRRDFSLSNDEAKCLQLFFSAESFIPYIGNIIRRRILDTVKIDKSFIGYFDVYLWASLLVKGYKIGYIDKNVAGYRIHTGQVSSLANRKKLIQYTEYEKQKYADLFLEIQDVDLLKRVFDKNPYFDMAKDLTPEDLKFIVYYEMLFNPCESIRYNGYYHIYDILQDDEKRAYMENKFSFGIKEFREIYASVDIGKRYEYSIKFLAYTLVKAIIKKLSLSNMRNKKEKQESM